MSLLLHVESPVERENLPVLAQLKRMDPIGVLFFIPSMVCLILALQWGGSTYAWSTPLIIGLLVAFSVLFIAFIVAEVLSPATAIAPMRIVLNRSIAGSMVFMFLLSGGLMSVLYYLTAWFQAVKNDSAMRAGISTIPLILSFILIGIVAAGVTQKVGYYVPAMLVSPVFGSVGAGLLSTLSLSSNHKIWIGHQVLLGLGIGCGFQTSMLPAQTVLPRKDVPLGLSLMFFCQQVGGAIFLAVSQNVFSSTLVNSLSGKAGLDAKAIVNTGATNLRTVVPKDQVTTVVKAYSHALTRVYLLTAILNACMVLAVLVVEWKKLPSKPKKTTEDSPRLSENSADDEKNAIKRQD